MTRSLSVDEVNTPPPGASLQACRDVFRRWLGDDYDLDAIDATLAAAAVERLDGDLLWLLLVSGSGNAKTETVQALIGADALIVSTITSEAALISGTAAKERAKDATGGLLHEVGTAGCLVIKDLTSILSMQRDQRALVLGALREIYDGHWVRRMGTDGGRRLPWTGRVAVVGAVTTAWDQHHAAIAAMGDRFVLLRMDSANLTTRASAGRNAIRNTGQEVEMRAELAAAAGAVLAEVPRGSEGITLTDDESELILSAANLVTLIRTGVIRDYHGKDVLDCHAPEMPTRCAKQLAQVVRGGVAIGMDRADALRLALRIARDSMPPQRAAALRDIIAHPVSRVADVQKRMRKPRATVDVTLQELHILGCIEQVEVPSLNPDSRSVWHYSAAPDLDVSSLAEVGGISQQIIDGFRDTPPTLPGVPECSVCGKRNLWHRVSVERGTCEGCSVATRNGRPRAVVVSSQTSA